MKKETMHCPKCHNELIKGQPRMYETLCDHVCDPNATSYPLRPTFVCNNKNCIASSVNVFWDELGNFYGWCSDLNLSYDDMTSAYPSNARKCDTEIYKKGLKSDTRLHPALMLWFLQPIIEHNYKADDWGNILKRSWKLKWLRKEKIFEKAGYHIYYTFPFVNIVFFLKYKKELIRHIKEVSGITKYTLNELKREFAPIAKWDKRWWRHVELFLAKIIFRKWYLMTK